MGVTQSNLPKLTCAFPKTQVIYEEKYSKNGNAMWNAETIWSDGISVWKNNIPISHVPSAVLTRLIDRESLLLEYKLLLHQQLWTTQDKLSVFETRNKQLQKLNDSIDLEYSKLEREYTNNVSLLNLYKLALLTHKNNRISEIQDEYNLKKEHTCLKELIRISIDYLDDGIERFTNDIHLNGGTNIHVF
jgi:hypothetical protein